MFKLLGQWFKQRFGLSNQDKPGIAMQSQTESSQQTTVPFESIDSASHLVPYDENLLERARSQWQFGDWNSLAKLDRDALQHHPDRAKLALLAAAGHQGLGNAVEARQFARLAMEWGCSKKLLIQILISGVHNTLGRAAAFSGHKNLSLRHFELAIALDSSGSDKRLLSQARITEQLTQLGILTDNGFPQISSPAIIHAFETFHFNDGNNANFLKSKISNYEKIETLNDLKSCIWIKEIEASKHALLSRRKLIGKFFEKNSSVDSMVSILLPTIRPENIENIIKNISGQNYKNIELIVIPQFFSDYQLEFFLQKINTNCQNLKNLVILRLDDSLTLGARLNKAIEVSAGKYWAKMDDDDVYFPNYLSDMLLPFHFDNYALIGKREQFVYLAELNKMMLKNPGARDRLSTFMVSGATFVVNKSVAIDLRFGDLNSGEDTALIKSANDKKLKIYAADPFNHILVRSKSIDLHTWKISSDSLLKSGVIICNDMRTDLVEV